MLYCPKQASNLGFKDFNNVSEFFMIKLVRGNADKYGRAKDLEQSYVAHLKIMKGSRTWSFFDKSTFICSFESFYLGGELELEKCQLHLFFLVGLLDRGEMVHHCSGHDYVMENEE